MNKIAIILSATSLAFVFVCSGESSPTKGSHSATDMVGCKFTQEDYICAEISKGNEKLCTTEMKGKIVEKCPANGYTCDIDPENLKYILNNVDIETLQDMVIYTYSFQSATAASVCEQAKHHSDPDHIDELEDYCPNK